MPQHWNKDSYGPISGSGANKLADSNVAPLVALARGYWSVRDKSETKALAEKATAASSTLSLTRKLNTLIAGEEDILVMPWYAMSKVAAEGTAAKSYNTQYRPSKPVRNAEGKTQKYQWFAGERLVLDLHPAIPAEWLDSSLDVLLTEGLLKGDSALTSVLLDAGVSVEQLSATPAPEDARSLLNALMLGVPQSQRVTVINSASVTTWEDQNDQWRNIRLTDRRVIVAFDGDLADNHMVWKQTQKAMDFVAERKGNPFILSLASPEVGLAQMEAGMDTAEKVGIDDYLAKLGTWRDLMSLITPSLPPEPAAKEALASVGDWRVHPGNDARVQEYAQETNPDGSKQPARWVDRYRVGGRVVNTIAKRRPTPEEVRAGVLDSTQDMLLEDAECEIEVALLDPEQGFDQEPSLHRVVGPSVMLGVNPAEWIRYARILPNEVLNHPEWPPRKGADWLSAVKKHRGDEREHVIAWNTMGWVPVDGGHPAFIIGNQVLGKTERDEERTRTGVTEHTLPGMGEFGLVDTYRELDPDSYRAQVREDIRTVLTAYIDNGFWRNRSTAVSVVAAMLRPTIPMTPGITLYFVGPRRAGKSFSAGFVLSGWEARPGTFSERNLNGSADDTGASIEHAVAHSPIWVVDDLAPQADRRKAEQMETQISQIIRNVANGSARRRMDGKTMSQREVANPIALLILTAENPPQVPSIQERIISVRIPSGAFDDSDDRRRMKELHKAIDASAASRLNAAMVRLWQWDDAGLGTTWAERQLTLREMFVDERETALDVLHTQHGIKHGEATRHANQVASLGLSLQVLHTLALWAGIAPDDPILSGFGSEPGSYMDSLYTGAAESIAKARAGSPGRALLRALAIALAMGRVHLRNPTAPGAPPFIARADDAGGTAVGGLNESAGWEYDNARGTWVPRGVPVGYLGMNDTGDYVALIDAKPGFQEARRAVPDLIPYGQSSSASWDSVVQEGFTKGGAPGQVSVRMRISESPEAKSSRHSGVPLVWDELVNAGDGID